MASDPSTYRVDDSDPRIQYSSGWRRGGHDDEFNDTTTVTSTPNASFNLTFVGTAISVFGTVDSRNSSSTYQIDGTALSRFSNDTQGKRIPGILFYQSPTLPLKDHILVGTNVGKKLILDYVVITSPPAPADIFSISTTPDSTSTMAPADSSEPCETSLCASKDDSSSRLKRSVNVGVVVGCTLGAMAFVGLLWVIWSICHGSREAQRSEAMGTVRSYSVNRLSSDIREERTRKRG